MTAGASENTQIQIGSNLNENLIKLMMFYSNLGQEREQPAFLTLRLSQ